MGLDVASVFRGRGLPMGRDLVDPVWPPSTCGLGSGYFFEGPQPMALVPTASSFAWECCRRRPKPPMRYTRPEFLSHLILFPSPYPPHLVSIYTHSHLYILYSPYLHTI